MTGFQLPGAEGFTKYLEQRLEGDLSVGGLEVLGDFGGTYNACALKWDVLHDGEKIGEYKVFHPKITTPGRKLFHNLLGKLYHTLDVKPGEEMFDREFIGDLLNGLYTAFGPRGEKSEVCREFNGIIPGYENKCVAVCNIGRTEEEKMPISSVSLVYDNHRFVAQAFHEGPGYLEETPWQRQDGHKTISFP